MFVHTAADLTRGQSTTRDEYEGEIVLQWKEPDEIEQRIRRGEIVNAPLLAAWAIFNARG